MKIRVMQAALLLFALGSCRTTTPGGAPAQVKDFDDNADRTLQFNRTHDYEFCADAKGFNIVNAYWMAVASNLVYAPKSKVTEVAAEIGQKWKAQVEFFSSPPPAGALASNSQAMWVELPGLIILSFRGTQMNQVEDIVTDMKAVYPMPFDPNRRELGFVHRGFIDGLKSIWEGEGGIKAKLKGAAASKKPIFVTGHSLGGALATLATAHMFADQDLQDVRPLVRALYTYGSPRVGDVAFTGIIEGETLARRDFFIGRFRNNADVVTRIPSSVGVGGSVAGLYEHVGPLYYISETGRIYTNNTDVNFRRLFMPSAISSGMVENISGYVGRNFVRKYEDHKMGGYLKNLEMEYALQADWRKVHNKDTCDMGLYAIEWFQPNAPDAPKPWTNEFPIAAPREVNGTTVKNCCWCYRNWYTSNWGRDQIYKQENFVGVIQEGEVASSNCMSPGGEAMGYLWWQPDKYKASNGSFYNHYYTYSQCERVQLVGDACVAGAEIFKDQRPSGRVIKKESWVP